MRNELLNFSCEFELAKKLRDTSKKTGIPMAFIIRKAITEYLEKEEKKQ